MNYRTLNNGINKQSKMFLKLYKTHTHNNVNYFERILKRNIQTKQYII